MKSSDEWIEEIERALARSPKERYFGILHMDSQTAGTVEIYFKNKGYTTEFSRCHQCENKWDVIITNDSL